MNDRSRNYAPAGSRVETLLYDGVGHGMISRDAAKPSVDWIADRLSGNIAPSHCDRQ